MAKRVLRHGLLPGAQGGFLPRLWGLLLGASQGSGEENLPQIAKLRLLAYNFFLHRILNGPV